MDSLKQPPQGLGPWGIVILMSPILGFVWLFAKTPFLVLASGSLPYYVIRGKLFTEKFDTIHAGTALDQPTIGKFLFLFTVMTILSLPYAAFIRWISDRRNTAGYWTYTVSVLLLCVFLLCIVNLPTCLLIQYISSMGSTPRRIYGLVYGISGAVLVLIFLCWAVRKPKFIEVAPPNPESVNTKLEGQKNEAAN